MNFLNHYLSEQFENLSHSILQLSAHLSIMDLGKCHKQCHSVTAPADLWLGAWGQASRWESLLPKHGELVEQEDIPLTRTCTASPTGDAWKGVLPSPSKTAENATSGETLEQNEAGDWGGLHLPSLLLLPHPLPTTPQALGSAVRLLHPGPAAEQGSPAPSQAPNPTPFSQQWAPTDSGLGRPGFPATEDYFK